MHKVGYYLRVIKSRVSSYINIEWFANISKILITCHYFAIVFNQSNLNEHYDHPYNIRVQTINMEWMHFWSLLLFKHRAPQSLISGKYLAVKHRENFLGKFAIFFGGVTDRVLFGDLKEMFGGQFRNFTKMMYVRKERKKMNVLYASASPERKKKKAIFVFWCYYLKRRQQWHRSRNWRELIAIWSHGGERGVSWRC